MIRVKRKLKDLECIMYMFQFAHLSESKRKHQTFFRKNLTSFLHGTSYI